MQKDGMGSVVKSHANFTDLIRRNIYNAKRHKDKRHSSILNKSIENEQRQKEVFINMREQYKLKKHRAVEFIERPLVIKKERLLREVAHTRYWTRHYKRLHWLYILSIINLLQEIREKYIMYRMRRIFETQKDRRIRLAQKFLCKAMKNRISEFYGIPWENKKQLTDYRIKGSLSIVAN